VNKQLLGPDGLTIEIPALFSAYVEAAIVRLQIHYPSLNFVTHESGIVVSGNIPDHAVLRSAVLHIVYREKIYAETLGMRQSLLAVVMR
jgi:hypothetical protein